MSSSNLHASGRSVIGPTTTLLNCSAIRCRDLLWSVPDIPLGELLLLSAMGCEVFNDIGLRRQRVAPIKFGRQLCPDHGIDLLTVGSPFGYLIGIERRFGSVTRP